MLWFSIALIFFLINANASDFIVKIPNKDAINGIVGKEISQNEITSKLLPKYVIPSHYDLTITAASLEDQRFNGTCKINFSVTKKTSYIIINSKNLTIEEITLINNAFSNIKIKKIMEYE